MRTDKKISLNELLRLRLPALIEGELSHSKVRRLIVAGGVFVNGRQVRIPSFTVFPSSSVEVVFDDDIAYELTPRDILFEDDSIIVVNKPSHFPTEAGMVGSRDNLHDAIVRFLFERQKIQQPNAKNPPYVGIMHRLDRDTSGVILFTKSRSVNAACHDMFESHTARKVYNALVAVKCSEAEKFPAGKKFTVDFPMGRISPKGQAAKWGRVSEKNGGLASRTDFEVLKEIKIDKMKEASAYSQIQSSFSQYQASLSKFTFLLLKCSPLTGRTHQIRVHLSSLGIPILGDTLYGGLPFERIMLHAQSLAFPHPLTGQIMTLESSFLL